MLKDSIHLRCPPSWRGRVRSRQVRKWFKKLEEGQAPLSSADPGPGSLELSIRLPRGALKRIAVLRRTSGTSLLRRLIAAQIGPWPSQSPSVTVPSKVVSVPAGPGEMYAGGPPPGAAFGQVRTRLEASPAKPSTILATVDHYRSLEEVGRALQQGGGITYEELLRWRAVYDRK
jgi:hypothetical protein